MIDQKAGSTDVCVGVGVTPQAALRLAALSLSVAEVGCEALSFDLALNLLVGKT